MRVLFVHTRFPGQFAPLAAALVSRGDEVRALSTNEAERDGGDPVPGVSVTLFAATGDDVANPVQAALNAGVAAARALQGLVADGFTPDVVYAHTGWGAGAFLKEVLPDTPVIKYFEWYYNNRDSDADFGNPDRPLIDRMRTRALDMPLLLEFSTADASITPTAFQAAQFPDFMRERITVVPDGIDTALYRPDPAASFALPDGRILARGDPVVSYVARGADPYRGYRPFLEALSLLQESDSRVEAVILGDDFVHYGPGAGTDRHRREVADRVRFDPARTHFLGRVPTGRYRSLLQVSAAHAYLTVPFVLSWSALEAMSSGCAMVASDTAPVREFVRHGENGLLSPFGDAAALAANLATAVAGGPAVEALRTAARATIIEHWSREKAIAAHLALLAEVAGR